MPFFSVVIPVYNRADLVGRSVASVLAQEFGDFEVIVVDDGSTDDTPAAVDALAAAHPGRVRAVHQPNRGPGPARNNGIRHAGGTYVAFLDSDDLWFPWTLARYREAIDRAGNPAIVFGEVVHFKDELELSKVRSEPLLLGTFDDYLATCSEATAATGYDLYRGSGVICVRADLLRKHGGFVERGIYCEDMDLLFRMGAEPGVAHVRRPAQIALRHHAGGSVGSLDRTCRGVHYLMTQEKTGKYPGGKARSRNRRWAIAHHVRFVGAVCMDRGDAGRAMTLWARSLPWQWALRRFKFVFGLPLAGLIPRLNPVRGYKRA